ncbi:MAG: biopolymer transporter ExbD, partial [Bdellovibrionia bacterium]
MLKRPSSRRKSHQEPLELNLVPILDAMVTLIGFLLFTTSFLAIVSIESPLPVSSPNEFEEQLKEKPLQLTLSVREKDVEIWSPFKKIDPKAVANNKEGQIDIKAVHDALVEVKKKFPLESNAVIIPLKGTSYDDLISLMDTVRQVEPSD